MIIKQKTNENSNERKWNLHVAARLSLAPGLSIAEGVGHSGECLLYFALLGRVDTRPSTGTLDSLINAIGRDIGI